MKESCSKALGLLLSGVFFHTPHFQAKGDLLIQGVQGVFDQRRQSIPGIHGFTAAIPIVTGEHDPAKLLNNGNDRIPVRSAKHI